MTPVSTSSTLREAAMELGVEVDRYSRPPFRYGEEIAGLQQACAEAEASAYEAEPLVRLVRLANAVLSYHDTPPGDPREAIRAAAMTKLIGIARINLNEDDTAELTRLLPDVLHETPETEKAVGRVREILGKLGRTAYDMMMKIITEVAAETAKKLLGLGP